MGSNTETHATTARKTSRMTDVLALDIATKTHSCPICGRWFADAKTVGQHMALTSKHETAATYIRRLEFMLAEAEDNLKFWRDAVRMSL